MRVVEPVVPFIPQAAKVNTSILPSFLNYRAFRMFYKGVCAKPSDARQALNRRQIVRLRKELAMAYHGTSITT